MINLNRGHQVTVLMSTWNGEAYIEQQLQSIFKQTYSNIKIIIRDDGSTDGTLAILRKHSEAGLVELIEGENLGFVGSFFQLMEIAPYADFYFFADQDDVWLEFKVERAVEKLCKQGANLNKCPALYYSNYDFYDESLNFIGHNKFTCTPSLAFAVSEPLAAGFTCVLNRCLIELMGKVNPSDICSHDHAALMLALSYGKVIQDDVVTAKYRRHSRVASPSGKNFFKQLSWRLKFLKSNRLRTEFYEVFRVGKGLQISSQNKKLLRLLAGEFNPLVRSFTLCFYSLRFRTKWIDELLIRCLFLINVI